MAAAAQRAGRRPEDVEILAATKYVAPEEIGVLAEAGISLAGENRAQDLAVKAAAHPELTWDFIGHMQSRKVKQVLPHVRLDPLGRERLRPARAGQARATRARRCSSRSTSRGRKASPASRPSGWTSSSSTAPSSSCGLMTMPPLASDPEDSRRWFAALAELARRAGLARLSMGTTQDYVVAVEEGATIVRIGTSLYG